jgi:DNA primase
MRDQVEEVKSKVNIVDIISEYVDLKKAGTNFKGICPFHSEKSPSFMVNPELQIFKCFGCSESGDVFSFLEKYEGMEFYETLKFLAGKVGVEIKQKDFVQKDDREKLYETIELAHRFYQYMLTKHESGRRAMEYLQKERGLSLDTISAFGIGYSPNDFNALEKVLVRKEKASASDLEKVGLVYMRNGRPTDRFRGRVMFPLFDHRGNLNGFAGRILPELDNGETGKYINSPETILHHKGNMLFGLWTTRKEIKKQGYAIVVEGPMDAIASYQGGIKNVVAIQGTSLTQEQVKLISRFTKKLVFCLDSDFAGVGAERRGIELAEAEGLEVRVAQLSDYKDPGEAAIKDPSGFKKAIKDAIGVWDFIIDSVIKKYNNIDGENKAKISRELAPLLGSISDSIVRAHYIGEVAQKLRVPIDAVSEEVSKKILIPQIEKVTAESISVIPLKKDRRKILEERLISFCFQYGPSFILLHDNLGTIIESPFLKTIVRSYLEFVSKGGKEDIQLFANTLSPELRQQFSDLLFTNQELDNTKYQEYNTELQRLYDELELLIVRSQLDQVSAEIKVASGNDKKQKLLQAKKLFLTLQKLQSSLEERSG